jgi:uncharacterized membrane protein
LAQTGANRAEANQAGVNQAGANQTEPNPAGVNQTPPDHAWTDQRIENMVGNLLRTGVSLSAFVVFFGGVIYLVRHGRSPADYRVFHGEPSDFRTLSGIIRETYGFRGRGIIQLGLLLLIATPVVRVALSIWGFAAEHDRMYMIFTGIVLIVLLYSLLGSGSAF